MIRKATIDDVENLCRGAESFYNEKLKAKSLTFDKLSSEKYFKWIIEYPESLVLIADNGKFQGAIGGVITPWILDFNLKIMTEMFWFVFPEHRGRIGIKLIKDFEAESKAVGANRILMVGLETINDAVSSLYIRRGYAHLEHHFIKEL